jgi:hypothetical protein
MLKGGDFIVERNRKKRITETTNNTSETLKGTERVEGVIERNSNIIITLSSIYFYPHPFYNNNQTTHIEVSQPNKGHLHIVLISSFYTSLSFYNLPPFFYYLIIIDINSKKRG